VGAVEAFLGHPKSTIDFICDGVHVHPGAIRAALAARGWQNVIAITDSNIGAGLPAGVYPTTWGYEVSASPDNAARIHHPISPKHGALAGSSLTLDRAVANLNKWFKLNPPQLWAIASSNPARVIRSDRGRLAVGAAADLVLWNDDFTASRTWVGGQLVYSQDAS
jgi:N-acetylglucosamine-6-phosphate deacetylase